MATTTRTLHDNPAFAHEQVMMLRLLDAAKEFFRNPKNNQAFEAWKKQKEAINHGTNNN